MKKIAINGFGRIGRIVARQYFANPAYKDKFELVALNDTSAAEQNVFAFKYDTTHGRFSGSIEHQGDNLKVNGQSIKMLSEKDATKLAWKNLGVDVVLECTGRFTDRESASQHLSAGAKKVIISAPAKGPDATFVMGVNHQTYEPAKHHIVSNASCTTNCLAPMAMVIHKKFGIKRGLMTTIHSYTSDQRILDNSHKDPRRARTAAANLIPTTTGAAKAVGEVIPELKGKLDGFSVRVPTPNVSLTDLVAELKVKVTKEEIIQALETAARTELNGILDVCQEPLVSSDFNGNTHSSIIDSASTFVIQDETDGSLIKVCSWYDNEVGFSARMLDLVAHMTQKGL